MPPVLAVESNRFRSRELTNIFRELTNIFSRNRELQEFERRCLTARRLADESFGSGPMDRIDLGDSKCGHPSPSYIYVIHTYI